MPRSWRRWAGRQAWERQPDTGWELLGLKPGPSGLDAAAVLAGTRFARPDFPAYLLPVEQLPESQLACVRLDGSDDPPVVIVDLEDSATWHETRFPVFERFSHYVTDFEDQAHAWRRISNFLRALQTGSAHGRRTPGQAPRPDDWRVYRFCSQNVVVAMVLLRFNRDDNILDVGACLITALSSLDPDAPARALCTLLLAEAHRSGGDLTVRFVRGTGNNAASVPIPGAVCRWSDRVGVVLDRRGGLVDRDAGCRLFVESVNIGEALRTLLREADAATAAATCYGVASGLWAASEVETLLAWSPSAGFVLRGLTDPMDRAHYACDVSDVRVAMLVAAAHRKMSAGVGDALLDAEDVGQRIGFTANNDLTCDFTADRIDLTEWMFGGYPAFAVTELRLAVADAEPDQLASAVYASIHRVSGADGSAAVLCPRDIVSLAEADRERLVVAAEEAGVVILAAPEYTPGLTIQAVDKLTRARTARQ
ncbi:hypothetical protein [Amycolatopsis sp. lyj-109]|uniref:hypothetical protein n=1 Tax=Amycolatopsis sp. lyj-109 TaxID=2789287 RepID=UPI00397E1DB7